MTDSPLSSRSPSMRLVNDRVGLGAKGGRPNDARVEPIRQRQRLTGELARSADGSRLRNRSTKMTAMTAVRHSSTSPTV